MPEKLMYEGFDTQDSVFKKAGSSFKYTDEDTENREFFFHSIMETINECVILQSSSDEILALNKKAEDFFNLNNSRLPGINLLFEKFPMVFEDGSACAEDDYPFNLTLKTGKPCDGQIMGVYRAPDDLRWISVNARPMYKNGQKKPFAVTISFSDITDLKTERDTSQNYLDVAGVMILALDEAGEVTLINRKGCEILGGDESEFLGKNWFDLFTPSDIVDEVKGLYRDLIDGKIAVADYAEHKIKTLAGVEKDIAWHSTALKDKDGRIIGSLCSGEDITEKKRAQESLLDREELLNRSQEMASVGSFFWDIPGKKVTWSRNMYALNGVNEETFEGDVLELSTSLIHPDDFEKVRDGIRDMLNRENAWDIEFRLLHPNGEERNVRSIGTQENNAEGRPVKCYGICQDITERRLAECEQEKLQGQLSTAIEIACLGPWEYDVCREVFVFNDYFYKVYGTSAEEEGGYEMSAGEYVSRFIFPDDAGAVLSEMGNSIRLVNPDRSRQIDHRIVYKDGSTGYVTVRYYIARDENGNAAKVVGVNQDVTAHKLAEAKLRESEEKLIRAKKMESLGLLAGGVAHDLNNVLSGIVSYPELLLLSLPEDSKYRKPVKTIHDSGIRAAAIVQDLLTIARGVATPREVVNLNKIINEYKTSPEYNKLLQYHPTVKIETELSEDLMNISGSPIHIRKLVMNLVSNASEAIEGSGNVLVRTQNIYVDRPIKGYEDVKTGEYAVLSVSDNGSGIEAQYLEKNFEPFFTKKIMGRSGTGLGLAVVWNIVQDHEGYFDVTSDDTGTTFKMYFPINRDYSITAGLHEFMEDFRGNGEKILIVDDEESQREITCNLLKALGYETEAVASGEAAVEYLAEKKADLVILDMIMEPGINGCVTYEQIIKNNPAQKAMIVSGYAETGDVKKAQKLGAGKYIKKPLTLQILGLAVKDELKK